MRLFVGLSPPPSARRALARTGQMLAPLIAGRYVPEARYHITLAFLGQVAADRLPAVCAALAEAARLLAPFAVSLGGVGSFGDVLWRGVQDDAALRACAQAVRASLIRQGVAFDGKPFRPHITLARHARPRAGEADAQTLSTLLRADSVARLALPGARFSAKTLTLYESTRTEAGELCYIPRAEVPL